MRRPLTVELLLRGGGARTLTNVTPAEPGRYRVDLGADAANVTGVRVRDTADNTGTASL